jgi:hypothetical protein
MIDLDNYHKPFCFAPQLECKCGLQEHIAENARLKGDVERLRRYLDYCKPVHLPTCGWYEEEPRPCDCGMQESRTAAIARKEGSALEGTDANS